MKILNLPLIYIPAFNKTTLDIGEKKMEAEIIPWFYILIFFNSVLNAICPT